MNNKLELIIVAFDYLDILSTTLPKNLAIADHVVILTKENDPVVEYCKSLKSDKLTCITTDAFNHNGAEMNKGLAINVGLQNLFFKDWVLLLDSDCILPADFKEKVILSNLDKENMYGCRRFNIESEEEWLKIENNPDEVKNSCLYRGFCYGFFQLVNYNSSTYQRLLKNNHGVSNLPYPYWITGNHSIDWLFSNEWGGQMVYNPPLEKFPDDHYKDSNDTATGLLKELPINCIHLDFYKKQDNKVYKINKKNMNYKEIEGWFSWESVADEFVEKSQQDGTVIVELGAWMGKSTAYQAQKIKESGKNIKFYTVDTFKGAEAEPVHVETIQKNGGSIFHIFQDNMVKCGVENYVTPLEMTSAEASAQFEDSSIDFLFVDAGHRYEDVISDLNFWYKKVKVGGIIAGHDAEHPPVGQALKEFFGEYDFEGYKKEIQNNNEKPHKIQLKCGFGVWYCPKN